LQPGQSGEHRRGGIVLLLRGELNLRRLEKYFSFSQA
jgi:hypothetical protein